MTISFAQSALDAPLDAVAAATELYLCTSQPASRAAAIAAAVAPAIVMSGGDYAKSSSGANRRLTVAAKAGTTNLTAAVTWVALCSGSTLLYARQVPSQVANDGSAVNVSSFTIDTVPEAA